MSLPEFLNDLRKEILLHQIESMFPACSICQDWGWVIFNNQKAPCICMHVTVIPKSIIIPLGDGFFFEV